MQCGTREGVLTQTLWQSFPLISVCSLRNVPISGISCCASVYFSFAPCLIVVASFFTEQLQQAQVMSWHIFVFSPNKKKKKQKAACHAKITARRWLPASTVTFISSTSVPFFSFLKLLLKNSLHSVVANTP